MYGQKPQHRTSSKLALLIGVMACFNTSVVFAEDSLEETRAGLKQLLDQHIIPILTEPQIPKSDNEVGQEPAAVTDAKEQKTLKKPVRVSIEELVERDPTLPGDYFAKPTNGEEGKDPKVQELKLTAIFSHASKHFAVVNDQVVKEGDLVAGQRVESIDHRKVVLDDTKKKTELTLFIPSLVTYPQEDKAEP